MNNTLKVIWNASLTALVITVLAGLFVLAMPPTYRATATIIADANQQVLFRSGDLLKEAIEHTGIDTGFDTGAIADFLQSWTDNLLDRETPALNLLRQRLTVRYDEGNGWFEISVQAVDPEIAASLANAVATAFLRRAGAGALTDETRDNLQLALARTESDIIEFTGQHPDLRNTAALEASLDRQAAQLDNRIEAIDTELIKARTELAVLRSGDLAPVAGEPEIRRLLQKQQQLMAKKAELSTRYGNRHQKIISLDAEITAAATLVNDQIARAEVRSQLALEALDNRVKEIRKDRDDVEDRRLAFDRVKNALNEKLTQRDRLQMQARGTSTTIDEGRYSAAIPPESSLGFGQVQLMLMVFLASFVLITVIQLIRPR